MTRRQKYDSRHPVILCGGSGSRVWPLSRTGFLKQFLCLIDTESLFQQAAQRLASLCTAGIQVAAPLIVTGEDNRFLASARRREICIDLGCALLEPIMGVLLMILRETTERPETVTLVTNVLLGTDPATIGHAFVRLFAGQWQGGGVPPL